jgi:shikimate dehydrogenase
MRELNPSAVNLSIDFAANRLVHDSNDFVPKRPFMFVLGSPILHSLSPVMQQAALDSCRIKCDYFTLDPGELLSGFRDVIDSLPVLGFNVTTPYKKEVSCFCDSLTDEAIKSGNVNCVKIIDNNWIGHNTDIGGMKSVIRSLCDKDLLNDGFEVVVLGTGSVARSVMIAIDDFDFKNIEVRYHSSSGASSFVEWHKSADLRQPYAISRLSDFLSESSKLFINCLTIGNASNFIHPSKSVLIDLKYPVDAPCLNDAVYVPGTALLIEQGALAFKWWFGGNCVRSVMSKEVLDILPE